MKCPFCIKVCTKCKRILVAYKGNFPKMKTGKYGFDSKCKECDKKSCKQYYENNKEHVKEKCKEYYENNKEYYKEYKKQYYKDNSEHKEYNKQYSKQWYKDNKEHKKEYNKQWREDNSEYKKEYNKQQWDKYLKENNLQRGEGSIGEQRVRHVLRESNFTFSEQHKFDDCKFYRPLPFDFYIPNLNIAIEYDGRQHFEISEYFGGLDSFINTIIRDTIKNDYCRRNNIRLIRIPYWEFDNIEEILSDLL